MWIITLWLVISYSLSGWSQHANPQTWAEIESALSANQIKMSKLLTEKDMLVRERSRIVNLERDKEIGQKLGELNEEILKLQMDADDLQRQLQFRFPERGLQMGITDPISIDLGNSQTTPLTDEKNEKLETDNEALKQDSVPKAMELLRRQYGQPVKSQLPTKKTDAIKNSNPSSEINPILDKIIIHK